MDNFIEVKNIEKAQKLLEGIPNGVEKAITNSINRSLTTLKKDLKKTVTKEYGIKSTDLEKSMVTRKATFSTLSGSIYSKSPTLSLYKFFKSNSTKGISILVKKSEGRKIAKGKPNLNGKPFLAKTKNGHIGIFQKTFRTKKKIIKTKRKGNVEREVYTIEDLKTLSIPQMLGSKTIMEYINNSDKVEEIISKNMDREIERILKGFL